jgi:hypothetical protein
MLRAASWHKAENIRPEMIVKIRALPVVIPNGQDSGLPSPRFWRPKELGATGWQNRAVFVENEYLQWLLHASGPPLRQLAAVLSTRSASLRNEFLVPIAQHDLDGTPLLCFRCSNCSVLAMSCVVFAQTTR